MVTIKSIAIINETPSFYGGAEHYLANFANYLRENNISITLFYHSKHLPEKKYTDLFDFAFPLLSPKEQIDRKKFDIVYLNNFKNFYQEINQEQLGVPVLKFLHDHYHLCPRSTKTKLISGKTCDDKMGAACFSCPGILNKQQGKFQLRYPKDVLNELKEFEKLNGLIVSSSFLMNQLKEYNYPMRKVWGIPLYSHTKVSKVTEKKKDQIIYVGSLIKGKGVELLIEAFTQSKINFDLIIIGDGPLREKLEKFSSDKIHFAGHLDKEQVEKYYQESRAVIVPSLLPETFSLAGVDALKHGTLPICSNVGGISQWLKNQKNGVLFESGNAEELSSILQQLGHDELKPLESSIARNTSNLKNLDLHFDHLIHAFKKSSGNFKVNSKYSHKETPEFIQKMDFICNTFKAQVLKHVPEKNIEAILLIGGYGRGEGGVRSHRGELFPHNNLDFNIITKGVLSGKGRINKKIRDGLKSITEETEVTIDFSINSKFKILFSNVKLIHYDMKYGHRLIYGNNRWLRESKKIRQKNIPINDIRELILNRGTLLLLNDQIMTKAHLNDEDKKVIYKHIVKGIIGYGDALLFIHGKYDWSYLEKRNQMRMIANLYPEFSKIYLEAVHFRFNPNYKKYLQYDPRLISRYILRHVEKIHLQFESHFSNQKINSWENFFNEFSSNPFYAVQFNMINIIKIMISLFKGIKSKKNFNTKKICQSITCRVLGENGQLFTLFPFILYKKSPPESFKEKDINQLRINYIKIWGKSGDINFDQSSPAKIIKEAS